jgi:hypothetical protein
MHPSTRATLKELEEVEWFRNVGVNDVSRAIVLPSWEEAMRHCISLEWMNLSLFLTNELRTQVRELSSDRFQKWNELIDEIKAYTIPFVADKCRGVIETHALPQCFMAAVNRDILHLCMECEYSDIVPPAFFAGNAYWYVAGHFPCGWKDEPPSGRPIVF